MNIHRYQTTSGRDLIKEYIDGLSESERVDAYYVMQCMENDRMEELYTKPWQDKIWEVYFYKHNRIFYVAINGTDIYLLHACRKQKNKTERKDAKVVIDRAKELGQILGKRIVR